MPFKDKAMQLAAQRRHYARNSEAIKANVAKVNIQIRERNKAYVDGIKSITPCMDCGVIYPPYVMQFDHVGGDKRGAVANLVREGVSIETLQIEIDKCELVCGNCHAERTHARKIDAQESLEEWL
jgi:hypothetical protein